MAVIEISTSSYGNRMGNSVGGVISGMIFFIASFGLLYWNEGRVDLSVIAKTAIPISAQSLNTDPSLNNTLVSASGIVNSHRIIGDNLYLKPDRYMALRRNVEMFAWVEESKSSDSSHVGGSDTTTTTYTYSQEWTEHPKVSGRFKHPQGHENPQKTLDSITNTVSSATIGLYNFDPHTVELPEFSSLVLNAKNIIPARGVTQVNDSYLYIKKSKDSRFDNPHLGDLRIHYTVLYPDFDGTIFGRLSGDKITPFIDQSGNRLYRLFAGSREEGIVIFHTEYITLLWELRLVGFVMMWFGLFNLLRPLTVLFDFLPALGSLTRSIAALIAFLVALILAPIVIAVSAIIHNLVALVIILVLSAAGVLTVLWMSWKKKAAVTQKAILAPPSVKD